jgi:hypothetical protein
VEFRGEHDVCAPDDVLHYAGRRCARMPFGHAGIAKSPESEKQNLTADER